MSQVNTAPQQSAVALGCQDWIRNAGPIGYADFFHLTPDYDYELLRALRQCARVVFFTARGPRVDMQLDHSDDRPMFLRRSRELRSRTPRCLALPVRALQMLEYQWDKERWLETLSALHVKLVHIQWWLFPLLDTVLIKELRRRNIRIVHTAHNAFPHEARWWNLAGLRQYYEGVDRIIVHSTATYNELTEAIPSVSPRVRIVPHGPLWLDEPCQNREACRSWLRWPRNEQVLLFWGGIRPYKGLDVLLRALEDIPRAGLRLVVAGKLMGQSASVLRGIERAQRHLKIDLTLGYCARADLVRMICGCDAVVLPYRHATQSGVAMVGVHFKVPQIVTRTGGLPEIMPPGTENFIAEPGSHVSLRRSIELFLNSSEQERCRWREKVGEIANGALSWNSIAERTLSIYNEIL